MTKAQSSEQKNAQISALLDNHSSLDELIGEQKTAQLDAEKLGRYALIGDLMRADTAPVLIDIADSLDAQLASEPVYAQFPQTSAKPEVKTPEKDSDNVVKLKWYKPAAQVAIAASVALLAVVGVQNFTQTDAQNSEIPMLQSTPFAGAVSPVSFSTQPALDNAKQGLRELQSQRIGALVLEHQRQSREAHMLADNESKAATENATTGNEKN